MADQHATQGTAQKEQTRDVARGRSDRLPRAIKGIASRPLPTHGGSAWPHGESGFEGTRRQFGNQAFGEVLTNSETRSLLPDTVLQRMAAGGLSNRQTGILVSRVRARSNAITEDPLAGGGRGRAIRRDIRAGRRGPVRGQGTRSLRNRGQRDAIDPELARARKRAKRQLKLEVRQITSTRTIRNGPKARVASGKRETRGARRKQMRRERVMGKWGRQQQRGQAQNERSAKIDAFQTWYQRQSQNGRRWANRGQAMQEFNVFWERQQRRSEGSATDDSLEDASTMFEPSAPEAEQDEAEQDEAADG